MAPRPPLGEQAAKASLRLEMKQARAAIPAAERTERARLITASVLSLSEIREAEVVLAFSSFGTEVPTGPLLAALGAAGRTVLLPYLEAGEIHVAEHGAGDPLVETDYGPLEPALRRPADVSRTDVVIVPGLAFDRRGCRLGYGGGYYDRLLADLWLRPVLIAIAFAEQVLDDVPVADSDVSVDLVVTDAEVIRCRRR